ncbi:MAG: hypothetical protein ACFB9M_00115 [Myxococcota bacterium]
MVEHEEPSSGVRNLIERVRREGVEEGETEAKRIVDDARQKAARILDDARTEAERRLAEARKREQLEREAGRAALEQSARDTILRLEEELTRHFGRQLHRLVEHRLEDTSFLERLILELVGAERPELDGPAQVLLPRKVLEIQELRKSNPELGRDPVDAFVLALAQSGLREGVTFEAAPDAQQGIRIRLEDGQIEIDVTTEAVTELLQRHLLPRFRGLLEGVFR